MNRTILLALLATHAQRAGATEDEAWSIAEREAPADVDGLDATAMRHLLRRVDYLGAEASGAFPPGLLVEPA